MSNTQTYHLKAAPSGHTLIGPKYATASLPDDDYFGYHWKCTCGAEASTWIQNWPQSEEEAREEWRLHFEEPLEDSFPPTLPTDERMTALNTQTPDSDQVLPFLVVNTGGHPIARFANKDHARQYAAGWLGLLPPIDTASGETIEDAVAQWQAKVQPSDEEWLE